MKHHEYVDIIQNHLTPLVGVGPIIKGTRLIYVIDHGRWVGVLNIGIDWKRKGIGVSAGILVPALKKLVLQYFGVDPWDVMLGGPLGGYPFGGTPMSYRYAREFEVHREAERIGEAWTTVIEPWLSQFRNFADVVDVYAKERYPGKRPDSYPSAMSWATLSFLQQLDGRSQDAAKTWSAVEKFAHDEPDMMPGDIFADLCRIRENIAAM